MNVIVTGATGFVGQYLVDEFQKQGDKVTVLIRDKNKAAKLWKKSPSIVECTLGDIQSIGKSKFNEERYDLWVHLGWEGTSGDKRADIHLQLDNVQYTCDSVKKAFELGCKRFVNAGSIMEYEAVANLLGDNDTAGMGSIYSVAKLTADMMSKTYASNLKMDYINVIISNIYGVGERSARFLNTIIRKMLKNERISMTAGVQPYDFIYVTDAVKAIVLASKKGNKGLSYYIGNTQQKQLKDFVVELKGILNSSSELAFGEIPLAIKNITYDEFNKNRLYDLGFVPEIDFETGVNMVADWIKEGEDEYSI